MPYVAFVCRLSAWFVLGAGAAGAVFFVRYDGLGVPVAVFLIVLAAALAVLLWAAGRIAAETARLARRLAPPTPERASRLPWRRRAAARSAPAENVPVAAQPAAPSARPMTPAELDEFFGRPQTTTGDGEASLASHRSGRRPTDRG